jgi:hypothetical protein
MTNNQNWPDRVYFHHEVDEPSNWVQGFSYYPMCDTKLNNDSIEYISAEKVREIQLAAVKATLEFAYNESENSGQNIMDIDPESIIEQVGKV